MHKPQNLTEFMLCLHHHNEFYWQKKRRLHGVLAFEHIFIFYLVSTHYFWMCPHPKKLCCYPAYHLLNARTCICPQLTYSYLTSSSIDIFQMGYASKFIGSPSSSQAQISPPIEGGASNFVTRNRIPRLPPSSGLQEVLSNMKWYPKTPWKVLRA